MTSVNSSNASLYIRGLEEYSSDEELNSVPLFVGYPEHLIYFAVGCDIIFIIIGIPGNLITILALANHRKVRNATAMFIINLTLTDLLTCCVTLPVKINVLLSRHWIGGKIMCMAYPILKIGTYECSVFNIVAITLNRYVMVSHPKIYPKIYKKRNVTVMIFCIWLGAIIMLTPLLTELWGRISLNPTVSFCTAMQGKDGSSPKFLYIFVNFIFPFIFIITCYGRIIWIVRKSTKKMDNGTNPDIETEPTGPIQEEISRQESSVTQSLNDNEAPEPMHESLKKLNKTFRTTFKKSEKQCKPTRKDKKLQAMTTAILITFFLSHVPTMMISFPGNPYCIVIGYVLIDMTTCINPIIYVLMLNQYRQAYKHLFNNVLTL